MPVTTNTRKLAALLGASGGGIHTDGTLQTAAIKDGAITAVKGAADLATQAELDATAAVPSNLVAYRASGESTPTGWSEYTSCRGRMIVGLPSGGADAGTVGTAYTTAQDKSKSIAHTHTGPSHYHEMGFRTVDEFTYSSPLYFGTGGSINTSRHAGGTAYTSGAGGGGITAVEGIGNTSAMSTGGTVDTSDLCAYIQLMSIEKD